jgi:hypothetical protein
MPSRTITYTGRVKEVSEKKILPNRIIFGNIISIKLKFIRHILHEIERNDSKA